MALSRLFTFVVTLFLAAVAQGELLLGYGTKLYDVQCAWACRLAMPYALECPEYANMTAEEKAAAYPSNECFLNDEPYLTTMAWCIHSHCPSTTQFWKIAKVWDTELVYNQDGAVANLTYQQALDKVDEKNPPKPLSADEVVLNRTISFTEEFYTSYMNAVISLIEVSTEESRYGLLVFLSGVVVPVGLSLLRLLPFPPKLVSKFYAYFIDPPAWGKRHSVPVLGLALVPTRGQALFILYIITINIAGTFVGYKRYSPNSYFPDRAYELTREISNRAGVLSFANIPLVFLYGGRNSLLLWLTNWSHSTFLLLHRWIGFICTLHACLHSAMWLQIMVSQFSYAEASKLPYWYWGIIGTLSLSLLIPLSSLPLRKMSYEIFLIGHIFLAIMALVGSWYHILYLYDGKQGYDVWLYIAMAIWAFDRILRVVRIARFGVKRAYVTQIDDEYFRVDVPGVDCHGYCYAYFPSLSWKVWENHPFTVVEANLGYKESGTTQSSSRNSHSETESSAVEQLQGSAAKEAGVISEARPMTRGSYQHGISFFIRPHDGLTKHLAAKAAVAAGLPILIEATYGHEGKTFLQDSETKFAPTLEYPNTLCIAGGVGITAILPALSSSMRLYGPLGTTKLFWGIRKRGLVDVVENMITGAEGEQPDWGHIEPHITIGSRLNVRQILEDELSESDASGTTVIVCGPLEMCDEVRYTVAALARHGRVVRLMEESFTW